MVMGILKRAPSLLLKSTPPRGVRGFLDRQRLQLNRLEASGAQVTVLLAPTGFGKTCQLNHWRREMLERGGLAFWLTLDNNDDPLQLVRGLAYSAQLSCGKRGFADTFMEWIAECTDPREAITAWLAEIADLSVEAILLLDDADRLPTSTRSEILTFLLANAPANLHIALAARPAGALTASGALRIPAITRLNAADLRFRLDETLASLGGRCNVDAAAALHDLTEGWPFGVQLAAAALYRSGDLEGLLAAATSDIRRYFVDTVINDRSPEAVHLLVRLAIFDPIHPQLCAVALGRNDLVEILAELRDDTPLLSQTENSEWMRLHPLARDALRERLLQLPLAERQSISQKACTWYAANGLDEEAAQQALLAGNIAAAFDLVEHRTYQMTVKGKSPAVLAWYRHLSKDALRQYPGLWSPAAWALAMSEHHREAQALVELILTQSGITLAERFEAMLIESTAAAFADRADIMATKLAEWPEPPPEALPGNVPIHLVGKSFIALYRGQPDQSRLILGGIAELDQESAYSPVSYNFADYALGLSHLWEGRYALAEQVLRPALARAEECLGRHHPVTCMLAAASAQAYWDGSSTDDPGATLAGRLPLLEHHGLADALIAAYRTLARIAEHKGRQDQALNLLQSLHVIGQTRSMLRLQITAKYELARLHARHSRAESALALSRELDTLLDERRADTPDMLLPWAELHADLARTYAMLAQQEECSLTAVLEAAESALRLAVSMKRGGEEVEARLLRAEALRRQGAADARAVLLEAISLAQAGGMLRLLQEVQTERATVATPATEQTSPPTNVATHEHSVRGAALLTEKEREVLSLLSRSMSNKEIARAMVVSEETIKWHMKNLFSKFNAAGRKHVVARARMLGLVD
ncbi:LuxR family transcriptional regulator [Pseudomonas nitroreducens]|uniref:LuxR family transcriptional regulator n=2 Tax=Pseudomonas TaxID=286 RepID=A0A6G6J5X1_PSENT|nr:LuxR family transcriptional regulator [Pseudomonas nitroreducens]